MAGNLAHGSKSCEKRIHFYPLESLFFLFPLLLFIYFLCETMDLRLEAHTDTQQGFLIQYVILHTMHVLLPWSSYKPMFIKYDCAILERQTASTYTCASLILFFI